MTKMKWEYKVERIHSSKDHTETLLEARGEERWELVTVSDGWAYFKRELEE